MKKQLLILFLLFRVLSVFGQSNDSIPKHTWTTIFSLGKSYLPNKVVKDQPCSFCYGNYTYYSKANNYGGTIEYGYQLTEKKVNYFLINFNFANIPTLKLTTDTFNHPIKLEPYKTFNITNVQVGWGFRKKKWPNKYGEFQIGLEAKTGYYLEKSKTTTIDSLGHIFIDETKSDRLDFYLSFPIRFYFGHSKKLFIGANATTNSFSVWDRRKSTGNKRELYFPGTISMFPYGMWRFQIGYTFL